MLKSKSVIWLVSLILLAVLIVSCAPPVPTATSAPAPTKAPAAAVPTNTPAPAASSYKEAPALAELVKAGKLPAVDKRLPDKPMVMQPNKSVGKYGGTWRMIMKNSGDTNFFALTVNGESLLRFTPDGKSIIPNIAESYTASPDAKEFTFKLRKGTKWSDGKPLTAKDIQFFIEEISGDKELTPTPRAWLTAGGKYVKFEYIDDLNFKFKFEEPNGLFIMYVAGPDGLALTMFQAEYAKKFHKKYNAEAADKAVKDGQFKTWADMFTQKVGIYAFTEAVYWDPDRPRLSPWLLKNPYEPKATQVVWERNPYYWKVDPQGQQLPYIDKVVYTVMTSVDVMIPKALNGEVDMQMRHVNTLDNKALFFDAQQKGNFKFFNPQSAEINVGNIQLNLAIEDKVKNQIFNNKDFRIGLSYAINRSELIKAVLVGAGEPWQPAPRKDSVFYNEKMAKQYTEFDLAKANEALDKAGYKKNDKGERLGPDGKPISFVVEVVDVNKAQVDMMNMIVKNWKEVGIDAKVKVEERTFFYNNKAAGLHEAGIWAGAFSGIPEVLTDPRAWYPIGFESIWAVKWADWLNKVPGGIEPPDYIKKQGDLFNQIKNTGDTNKQVDLMKQIIQIASDNFVNIGVAVSTATDYGIVKNNFHNVPDVFPSSWNYVTPILTNPEQYYIDPAN